MLFNSLVGKLITDYLMRHEPPDEDTSQETYDRQEYLSRNEVEPVEQRLAEEHQSVNGSHRQRTERTDDRSGDGHQQRSLLT